MAGAGGRAEITAAAQLSMSGVRRMVDVAEPLIAPTAQAAQGRWIDLSVRLRSSAEYVVIPLFALVLSGVLFALFLLALGKSAREFFDLVYRGGFGTSFSIQNTLQRSA